MSIVPLSEEYRPRDFNEVVGIRDLDRLASLIATPKEMPNLMFYGPAGTGKTSIAKIIIDKLKPIDCLKLNGSNKEDRNIDTISSRITNFGMSMSSQSDKPKIIFIDEVDNLTNDAFLALRGTIEKIIKNARFIVTCNYIRKIPEPIRSRFTTVEFKKPKDEEIFVRMRNVCDMEGIQVIDDILKQIIKNGNGDLRTILNNIQQLSANKIKTISVLDLPKIGGLVNEVYDLIMSKQWSKLRYEIPNKHPDYENLFVDLEKKFFNSDLETPLKATITEVISTGLYEMSFSFDKNIAFGAICSRLIKVI